MNIARAHGCVRNDSETHETVLLDCTTGEASNTSRVRFTVISHTPVRSRFYHIHVLYKRNLDGFWLMNLTQKSYWYLHISQIRNLFYCVAESWWNMPFKGTRHGKGMADVALAKLLRLSQHASVVLLWSWLPNPLKNHNAKWHQPWKKEYLDTVPSGYIHGKRNYWSSNNRSVCILYIFLLNMSHDPFWSFNTFQGKSSSKNSTVEMNNWKDFVIRAKDERF